MTDTPATPTDEELGRALCKLKDQINLRAATASPEDFVSLSLSLKNLVDAHCRLEFMLLQRKQIEHYMNHPNGPGLVPVMVTPSDGGPAS
jgi:hypothetical protein